MSTDGAVVNAREVTRDGTIVRDAGRLASHEISEAITEISP